MTLRGRAFGNSILILFVMCIGFALSAALQFSTEDTARPYLLQGVYLLALVAAVLMARGASAARARVRLRHPDVWALALGGFILLGGLMARFWVIREIPIEPASDFETYYNLAERLADGVLMEPGAALLRAYVAKFPHTIGFPMLLAPAFRLFGASVWTAQCLNLVFSMGSVLLLYAIGRRIGGRGAGLVAMALAAFWPSQVLYSTMVATEPSFSFLLLAAFYAAETALMCQDKPIRGIVLLLTSGILLRLAGSIRPVAVLLLAALAVAVAAAGPRKRRSDGAPDRILSIRTMCIALILATYLTTGWILNQRVSEEIGTKPVSGLTASGYNLMVGTNVEHKGLWNQEDADFFDAVYQETGSAHAAHEASMAIAIENVKIKPLDVINLMVYKFRDLWQSDDFGIDWNLLWAEQQGTATTEMNAWMNVMRPVGRGLYMGLLLFSLLGVFRMRKSGDAPYVYLTAMLLFLATAALHMALETQVRYHYYMLYFLMIPAACVFVPETRTVPAAVPIFDTPVPASTQANAPAQSAHPNTSAPFDLGEAIHAGHIKVTISQASASEPDGKDA